MFWRKRKHWDEPTRARRPNCMGEMIRGLVHSPRNPTASLDMQREILGCSCSAPDASEKGCGAVCYIRYTCPDGWIHFVFVITKNRVVHLRQSSIPRLELRTALLTVWLADTAKRELNLHISETIFWSDSRTVLCYISNESHKFHTFVANSLRNSRLFRIFLMALHLYSPEPSSWLHTGTTHFWTTRFQNHS